MVRTPATTFSPPTLRPCTTFTPISLPLSFSTHKPNTLKPKPNLQKLHSSFPSSQNEKKLSTLPLRQRQLIITKAASEYKFPDPIPEFADAEIEKFKTHLLKRLSKKDIYGESVEEVVGICTEIFSTFLHSEYGGPGTLLVNPFVDMADAVNDQGFPGGSQAARVAVKWAQEHVDKDWKEWTGGDSN
ncbi:hypothetical protein RIF29_26196 [Crotalaria pallida]|uniref:Uncharacterized protein n=1 Tax=Crotalaria pallida TaxID=3830 RepID=A0AAN9END1_CROPI